MDDDKEKDGCDCGSCPGCGADDASETTADEKEVVETEDEDAE
ncbi:MAG: hypothetical protein WC587_00940 [Candidatus Paceibacterota bacterium]